MWPPETAATIRACRRRRSYRVWPTATRGQFYRLDLVLDVYSRMIVSWEVHVDERAEHAATLITKACLRHGVRANTVDEIEALLSWNTHDQDLATNLAASE